MTERPSTSARRSCSRRPVRVAEAVAVLARWLAELLNDEGFRARGEAHARKDHCADCT